MNLKKVIKNSDEDPRALIFKALSSPKRIYILELLSQKEHCGGDFEKLLNVKQSAISRHLAILYRAGLINKKKIGSNIYYRVSSKKVNRLLQVANEIMKEKTENVRKLLDR